MAKRDNDNVAAAGMGGANDPTIDSVEQRMLAFAEQLGRIVGTVQAKAEGWLDRDTLNAQISTVRDSASELLAQLGGGTPKTAAGSRRAAGKNAGGSSGQDAARTSAKGGAKGKGAAPAGVSTKGKVASKVRASATSGATGTTTGGKSRSGGAVDAPGKKHRKPMPSESRATGAPRGEGARVAKLRVRNEIRKPRG